MNRIWITWERHRRTRELANAFKDLELYELDLDTHHLIRYPYLLLRTALIFAQEQPDMVFVQNPSMILSLFALAIGRIMNFRVVIDAHNAGIKPVLKGHEWLLPIYALLQSKADLTIVTNHNMANIVRANGGTPFVLADKIPDFQEYNRIDLKGKKNVAFICTFEGDEPYTEVIRAADLIDPSIFIYISGNFRKAPFDIVDQVPQNVMFTGFLGDQQYVDLVYSCDLAIDLTYLQGCLVCGAYEAIALIKPLILSDTEAQRKYFRHGVVFTGNRAEEIARSIEYTLNNTHKMIEEIGVLKNQLEIEWNVAFSACLSILDELERRQN